MTELNQPQPKLRELEVVDRQKLLSQLPNLIGKDLSPLASGGLTLPEANLLIENVIGLYTLPLALAENFRINDHDYLIPMCTEEPSVVAGAGKAAKLMRQDGGIHTQVDEPIATGQIQLITSKKISLEFYQSLIKEHSSELIELGNQLVPNLVSRGGGLRQIQTHPLNTKIGPMLIVHLEIDTRNAMGANLVNTLTEGLAPYLSKLTGARVNLRILTNLTVNRLARATASIPVSALPPNSITPILEAQAFAESDPSRAATHNKGIFNGIDAVALATGNDTRALEAGGHAYAARSGTYSPLTQWELADHSLHGKLELPLAVGTVGGLTNFHQTAKLCLEILGVTSSQELASVMVAAGLAQNFAALLALVTTGINRAHLPLHKRRELNQ